MPRVTLYHGGTRELGAMVRSPNIPPMQVFRLMRNRGVTVSWVGADQHGARQTRRGMVWSLHR